MFVISITQHIVNRVPSITIYTKKQLRPFLSSSRSFPYKDPKDIRHSAHMILDQASHQACRRRDSLRDQFHFHSKEERTQRFHDIKDQKSARESGRHAQGRVRVFDSCIYG